MPSPTEIETTPDPDKYTAWHSWKRNPTPSTLSAALDSVRPVINKTLDQYPGKSRELMAATAKQLAIGAIKTYDPSKGTALSTHVFTHLQPITRDASNMTNVMDRTRTDRNLTAEYLKAVSHLTEVNNREPSDGELMEHLKVNAKQLTKMRGVAIGEVPEGEYLPDTEEQPDEHLGMWTDYVYNKLPPQHQLIFDHKTGRNGRPQLSAAEIGKKLGVSEVYVNNKANDIAQEILKGVNS